MKQALLARVTHWSGEHFARRRRRAGAPAAPRDWTAAMTKLALVLLFAASAFAQTRNNDDTCDIAVAPAATLLLPYFEVDIHDSGVTTLVSITNVSPLPQIARVTLWSDWAYPVLAFNVFLTGYDVQSINLRDVLVRGVIGGSAVTPPGAFSAANDGNGKFAPTAATNCAQLPSRIPDAVLADLQRALTVGAFTACGTTRVGGIHVNAIGYATIDVVADCTASTPLDAAYFEKELLFDNVLIGDFEGIDPKNNQATGEPLVHIRAMGEGLPAGSVLPTSFPYTFYDRFSGGRDRRQPLPAVWAARYIQGGASGFLTNFKIWREGITGPKASCAEYTQNRELEIAEYIRFDERENPTSNAPQFITIYIPTPSTTVATSSLPSNWSMFPPLTSGDVAGWMYLNLDNTGSFRITPRARQAQSWIVASMYAEGRYAVDRTAVPLGNGCSLPVRGPTTRGADPNPIGPRP